MLDDQRRPVGTGAGGPALAALAGEGQGLLVGPLGDGQPLQAHAEAGQVHHLEHVAHAVVLVADQMPDRAAVVAVGHHAGGAGVDAELVLDGDAAHVVAGPGLARGVGQVLGHDEAAQPLGAGRSPGDAGQHHVDDVGGQVVLAVGDEDLGAGQPVGPVGLGLGPSGDRAQVGPGLGLGEVHGAGPLPRHQPRQVEGLLLGAAEGRQQGDRALGQQRAQRPGHGGGGDHLLDGRPEQVGEAAAAVFGIGGHRPPPGRDVGGVGVGEPRRGGHPAVVVAAGADEVAAAVEGGDHLLGEPGRLGQQVVDQAGLGVLESGQGGQAVEVGHPAQVELDLVEVDPQTAHLCDGTAWPPPPFVAAVWWLPFVAAAGRPRTRTPTASLTRPARRRSRSPRV